MKVFFWLLIAFSFSNSLHAQHFCDEKHSASGANNVLGFVPTHHRITNGLALGYSVDLDYCKDLDSVRINGVYVNISPLQPLGMLMMLPMLPYAIVKKTQRDEKEAISYVQDSLIANHKLNGLAIGVLEHGDGFCMQGLQVSLLFHHMDQLNGLSISSLVGNYYHFKGLMISGIYNSAHKGKGVQLGLVNKAKEMRGIQVGLWNSNGRRSLPFINWQFKPNTSKKS